MLLHLILCCLCDNGDEKEQEGKMDFKLEEKKLDSKLVLLYNTTVRTIETSCDMFPQSASSIPHVGVVM